MADTSATCPWCDEPLDATAHYGYHYACWIRSAVGSVAHLERRCSCYIAGSPAHDPEGLSRRQAAEVALRRWEELEGVRDG
jgi:hypothetical protein